MYPSKLGTLVAILAAAAGFSALAATAEAQISGTTGGNVFTKHPLRRVGDPACGPPTASRRLSGAAYDRGVTDPRAIALSANTAVSHDADVHDREADVDGTRWALVEYAPGAGRDEWCDTPHSGCVLTARSHTLRGRARDRLRSRRRGVRAPAASRATAARTPAQSPCGCSSSTRFPDTGEMHLLPIDSPGAVINRTSTRAVPATHGRCTGVRLDQAERSSRSPGSLALCAIRGSATKLARRGAARARRRMSGESVFDGRRTSARRFLVVRSAQQRSSRRERSPVDPAGGARSRTRTAKTPRNSHRIGEACSTRSARLLLGGRSSSEVEQIDAGLTPSACWRRGELDGQLFDAIVARLAEHPADVRSKDGGRECHRRSCGR